MLPDLDWGIDILPEIQGLWENGAIRGGVIAIIAIVIVSIGARKLIDIFTRTG